MKKILMAVMMMLILFKAYALVNKNENWLPMQQIAILPTSDISLDENYNGIVDNAEALNNHPASDFLLKKGGTLKGYLYLYYGIGKIIDMDDLNYYIDPSATSRFKVLCVNDDCIRSFDELNTGNTQEIENRLNKLEQWCINGDCDQGINANKLQGHEIGDEEGNIPVIDSSKTYYSLHVGNSINSQYLQGKNLSYFQPLLNEKCDEGVITGFEKGKMICSTYGSNSNDIESLENSLNEINETLTSRIDLLEQEMKKETSDIHRSIISNISAITTKYDEEIKNIKSFQQNLDLSSYQNALNQLSQSLNELKENMPTQIATTLTTMLSRQECKTGVMKGFDANGNVVCKSYEDVANALNSYLNYATLNDIYSAKQEINNNINNLKTSLKQYVDQQVSTAVKNKLTNKQCYGSLMKGFDANGNVVCKSYEDVANALNSYILHNIKNSLSQTYVSYTSLNSKLSNYIQKNSLPLCGNNQYLTVKNGILQCKSLPSYRINFPYSAIKSDTHYNEEGTFILECPEGYVMRGIKIKREEEEGWSGGEVFVRKIDLLCEKISITS